MRHSKEGDRPAYFPFPRSFLAKRSFRAPRRKRGACLWVETNQFEPGNARKE